MVELLERRVTRSLSNELQTRAAVNHAQTHQGQAQAQPPLQFAHGNSRSPNRSNSNTLGNRAEADGFSFEPPPYCHTTSEEIFIRTLVDGAIAQSSPTMDGLGLSNLPPASRKNSEELFSSWIASQEVQGLGAASSHYRTRQISHRISNEISAAPLQQHIASQQQLPGYEQQGLHVNSFFADDVFGEQLRQRTEGGDKASPAPDLAMLQAVPWLQQSPPMTRSRSAELRRMYAAMQGLPALPSADTLQRLATQGTHGLNQAVASLGAFARNMANGGMSQPSPVTVYPHSSNAVCHVGSGNSLSSMVSMLKGSLERKKLNDMNMNPVVGVPSSCRVVPGQLEPPQTFSAPPGNPSTEVEAQNAGQMNLKGVSSSGLHRTLVLTPAASPSESSGGAPSLSAGVAISDGPSNSGTVSTRENTLKGTMHGARTVDQPSKKLHHGENFSSPASHRSGDIPFEKFAKAIVGKKPEQLIRVGSLISSGRSGLGLGTSNPTKMRRVERREKMLEAKGRPAIPSDLQVAIKRSDALEKEVRSLKLTVSFMNRKDSEQTKRIEELEKENQELQEEKERLLEELEQLASGHNY